MNRFFTLFVGAVAILINILPSKTMAHPHAFIDTSITAVFNNEGVTGFRVVWNFDENFSSMIAYDYDTDEDGFLSAAETAVVKSDAFQNLKNFGYFTKIKIDGAPFEVKYVKDFSASLKDGKLTYKFTIPCHVKSRNDFREITAAQYDTTYYTYIGFSKNSPTRVENENSHIVDHKLAENKNESYYFGQIHPIEFILRFKNRS